MASQLHTTCLAQLHKLTLGLLLTPAKEIWHSASSMMQASSVYLAAGGRTVLTRQCRPSAMSEETLVQLPRSREKAEHRYLVRGLAFEKDIDSLQPLYLYSHSV